MRKVVFLGYAVNADKRNKTSGLSVAGNKMQLNILKGLVSCGELQVKSLTVFPVAPFPKDKMFFSKENINLFDEFTSLRVPFVNVPLIKQIWHTLSVYHYAKKEVDKDTIVVTFNQYPQIGVPSTWLKKLKKCSVISILADLPIDSLYNRRGLSLLFRRIFDNLTKKCIQKCDKLIVLNKNAAKMYAPGIPYIVVDGGVDINSIITINPLRGYSKKNIVYCGSLSYYSGVNELLKAMTLLHDDEAVLEIYGDGILKRQVEKYAETNKNIVYKGCVSNEEMGRIQRNAFLLVNPRPVNDPVSQVTFPSKMFEYLSSGTPVLTTKLNGLSEEYYSYVYFSNDDYESIAKEIKAILNTDWEELRSKALKAYDFVTTKKNWDVQNSRIVQYIKGE